MSRPLRVAIYARYSSDLQNPSSIEDQVALCRRLTEEHFPNASRVQIFKDAALSGSNMLRPGLIALLEDVAALQVDLIVSEGLDRISRNLGDLARIHQVCRNANVRIWTSHEGEVGDLHIGFKGTMNALFLKDLKDKIRRAHRARAADGRAPAGLSYGYRVKRDGRGDGGKFVNGLREIDEVQATVVRRIFQDMAAGLPVRSIVKSLNDEAIPSPGGGRWAMNSILGAASRGQGILHNELYRGVLVYNRTRKVIDPQTGRAKYVANPEAEWVRTPVPELRIVDDELWIRAHAGRRRFKVKTSRTPKVQAPHVEQRAARAHALTGLVYCAACGGMKTLADRNRYVCEAFRRTRSCKNARGTTEGTITERLFPELISALHAETGLKLQLSEIFREALEQRRRAEEQIKALRDKVERLLDAIENGVPMKTAFQRVADMEAEIERLSDLPKLPLIDVEESAIKRCLAEALTVASLHMEDTRFAAPIRRILEKVVERIDLAPIRTQRSGEDIHIVLRPGGWAQLYCHIHEAWPGVRSSKKAA